MSTQLDLRNRYTLITGASSGLGLEMARVVARDFGGHVIAVARRAERLEALRDELGKAHGVDVVPLAADLSKPGDVQRVFEQATQGRDVAAAVLNAGVTFFGHVLDQPDDAFANMLSTNVASLVGLSTRFAREFRARGGGALMLVSSMAGFSPLPYQTAYAATKAFVTSFGRGLSHEMRGSGVTVTVFAPGGIATEMLDNSGLSRKFKAGDVGIMDADACARAAVRAMVRRKGLAVPGVTNQLGAAMMKVVPHGLLLGTLERIYRGALESKDGSGR